MFPTNDSSEKNTNCNFYTVESTVTATQNINKAIKKEMTINNGPLSGFSWQNPDEIFSK